MPTEAQLVDALTRADAAGDHASAQQFAAMIKQQRAQAALPSQNTPQPSGQDQGGLMAGAESALDTATFGLAKPLEAAAGAVLRGIPYSQARANLDANQAATQTAHPTASTVGTVTGVVGSIPVAGEATALATGVPVVADIADAVANSSKLTKAAATVGGHAAVGAGLGYANSGTAEGAGIGAATQLAGAGVAKAASSAGSAAFRVLAKSIRLPNETLTQAANRLQDAADTFKSTFGRAPALSELVDAAQAKEISETIGRRANAGQYAAERESQTAVSRQGELSTALSSGGTTAAQGDVEAQAREQLDKAMAPINDRHVALSGDDTAFLRENESNLAPLLKGRGYSDARGALEDHVEHGTPMTVRNLETLRQAAARGAQSSDPVQAHLYGGIRDELRGMASNDPDYAKAMDEYAHTMRFGENLPEGAKGMTATPSEFSAGFRNQPKGSIGDAARAGQTTGLRTALSQAALKSPAAAARTAQDIAENAGIRQNIDTAMSPKEAASIKSTGEQANRAAKGMEAAVPTIFTEAKEGDTATSLAQRAALLAAHGGSSSFMANIGHTLMHSFGLPLGTARKVAEMSMDPKNFPAVLNYLRTRGTTAAQRHEFMNVVRQGLPPAAAAQASNFGKRP